MSYLPPFCTESDIAQRFASADAVGMCACCSSVIYADDDALHLPKGSICEKCLADLSDAELCEWAASLAERSTKNQDFLRGEDDGKK